MTRHLTETEALAHASVNQTRAYLEYADAIDCTPVDALEPFVVEPDEMVVCDSHRESHDDHAADLGGEG